MIEIADNRPLNRIGKCRLSLEAQMSVCKLCGFQQAILAGRMGFIDGGTELR